MRTIFLCLLLALPAVADELVLKDGKRVKWTVLKDLGDSFEVETTDGVKLEIKKSDVVKFESKSVTAAKKEEAAATGAALAGATFTWEKGRKLAQFDILRSIDVKRDAIRGNWKMVDGALVFDGANQKTGNSTMLETTYVPPEEYDLTVVAERVIAGDEIFFIGIVGGGHQVNWGLDARGGWQGPWLVDGAAPESSKQGFKAPYFTKVGEKKTIIIMVRTPGYAVKYDGKIVYTYFGEWSRLKPAVMYSPEVNTKSIFFGCAMTQKFKISQATVTFPKD